MPDVTEPQIDLTLAQCRDNRDLAELDRMINEKGDTSSVFYRLRKMAGELILENHHFIVAFYPWQDHPLRTAYHKLFFFSGKDELSHALLKCVAAFFLQTYHMEKHRLDLSENERSEHLRQYLRCITLPKVAKAREEKSQKIYLSLPPNLSPTPYYRGGAPATTEAGLKLIVDTIDQHFKRPPDIRPTDRALVEFNRGVPHHDKFSCS